MRLRSFLEERPILKDAASIAILVALLVAVFFPVLFQGKLMLPTDMFDTMIQPYAGHYGAPTAYNHTLTDAVMQSYPWKYFSQEALRSGHIAFWNPRVLGGYPQYASSRQAFDFFNLLLIPVDLPFAFSLIIILQMLVAGVGMYILLRCLRISRFVSTMFGAAWMFNGMFLTHALNLWATAVFCWVPVALAALEKHRQNRDIRWLFVAGAITALALLASTLQTAVYVVFVISVLALFQSGPGSKVIHWLKTVSIVFAVAFALSAIMWLPSIELFLDVTRHGSLYSPTHASSYSLLSRLLSIAILPAFYAPEMLGVVRSLSLTTIAKVHPLDFSGYLGFAELMMTTWAVFTLKKVAPHIRGFAWLMILGFTLPICTPLFPWLYHRFFIVGTLGAVVLGAERLERFLNGGLLWADFRKWHRGFSIAASAGFVLLAIVNLIFAVDPANLKARFIAYFSERSQSAAFAQGNEKWVHDRILGTLHTYSILSPTVLVPFAAIAISLLVLHPRFALPRRTILLTLFGVASLHSILLWRMWMPMMDVRQYPLLPRDKQIDVLAQDSMSYRSFVYRALIPNEQYLFLDNEPSMYGIGQISGYESELTRSFYPVIVQRMDTKHVNASFLGALGIRHLMSGSTPLVSTHLHLIDSAATKVYVNDLAKPRARLIHRAQVMPDDSAVVSRMVADTINDAVLFAQGDPHGPLIDDSIPEDSVAFVSETINTLRLATNATHAGYLLLSDTYYPGWKCEVEGVEVPSYRANLAMRAVYLSAGRHDIVYKFEPTSYLTGKWISIVSLSVLVAGLFLAQFKNRRK